MAQEAEERMAQEAEGSVGTEAQPQDARGAQPSAPAGASPGVRQPVRISSPEQVDDYIRVTTPGMWLLVLAMVILLLAGIVWAYAARIQIKTTDQEGQVSTEYIAPASFLTDGNIR